MFPSTSSTSLSLPSVTEHRASLDTPGSGVEAVLDTPIEWVER